MADYQSIHPPLESVQIDPPKVIHDRNWTVEVKSFIRYIEENSLEQSKRHNDAGHFKRKLNMGIAIPIIILPAMMSPLSSHFGESHSFKIITPIIFAVEAVATSLATFFNYGKKSERHFNYAIRYKDLITDIKEEMCKPEEKRKDISVFTDLIKRRYDELDKTAPVL